MTEHPARAVPSKPVSRSPSCHVDCPEHGVGSCRRTGLGRLETGREASRPRRRARGTRKGDARGGVYNGGPGSGGARFIGLLTTLCPRGVWVSASWAFGSRPKRCLLGPGSRFSGPGPNTAYVGTCRASFKMNEHPKPLNVPKKRLCWPPLGLRPARIDKRRGRLAPGRPCHACHRPAAEGPVVARVGRARGPPLAPTGATRRSYAGVSRFG